VQWLLKWINGVGRYFLVSCVKGVCCRLAGITGNKPGAWRIMKGRACHSSFVILMHEMPGR
jgi:hypothetical protein